MVQALLQLRDALPVRSHQHLYSIKSTVDGRLLNFDSDTLFLDFFSPSLSFLSLFAMMCK
jgi:hypothetical protein